MTYKDKGSYESSPPCSFEDSQYTLWAIETGRRASFYASRYWASFYDSQSESLEN